VIRGPCRNTKFAVEVTASITCQRGRTSIGPLPIPTTSATSLGPIPYSYLRLDMDASGHLGSPAAGTPAAAGLFLLVTPSSPRSIVLSLICLCVDRWRLNV
jgi:hypothetical protein